MRLKLWKDVSLGVDTGYSSNYDSLLKSYAIYDYPLTGKSGSDIFHFPFFMKIFEVLDCFEMFSRGSGMQ